MYKFSSAPFEDNDIIKIIRSLDTKRHIGMMTYLSSC